MHCALCVIRILSECFPKNSLEQICINFTNEKIRQFSTNRLIKEELDFYEKDGLKIPQIDFLDNQNVIGKGNLIFKIIFLISFVCCLN